MTAPEPLGRPFEVEALSEAVAVQDASSQLADGEVVIFSKCLVQPQVGTIIAWAETEVEAVELARRVGKQKRGCDPAFTPAEKLEFEIPADSDQQAQEVAAQHVPRYIRSDVDAWYASDKAGTCTKPQHLLREYKGKVLSVRVKERGSRGLFGYGKRQRTYSATCGLRCELSVESPGRWAFESLVPRDIPTIQKDVEVMSGYLKKTAGGADRHLARQASDMEKMLALSTMYQLFDKVYAKKINALIFELQSALPSDGRVAALKPLEFSIPDRFDPSDAPRGIELLLDSAAKVEVLASATRGAA